MRVLTAPPTKPYALHRLLAARASFTCTDHHPQPCCKDLQFNEWGRAVACASSIRCVSSCAANDICLHTATNPCPLSYVAGSAPHRSACAGQLIPGLGTFSAAWGPPGTDHLGQVAVGDTDNVKVCMRRWLLQGAGSGSRCHHPLCHQVWGTSTAQLRSNDSPAKYKVFVPFAVRLPWPQLCCWMKGLTGLFDRLHLSQGHEDRTGPFNAPNPAGKSYGLGFVVSYLCLQPSQYHPTAHHTTPWHGTTCQAHHDTNISPGA